MEQLNSLQSSLLSLVKWFVERQSIVLSAMRDLRPDIIMRLENRGDPQQWAELRIEYSRRSQVGYWGENDEWEYFRHGGGCRLTHRQTGERIEWDAGDLNEFNLDWFVAYLQWLLNRESDDEDIRIVSLLFHDIDVKNERSDHQIMDQHLKWQAQILPILEQLRDKGLLTANTQRTHYTLKGS